MVSAVLAVAAAAARATSLRATHDKSNVLGASRVGVSEKELLKARLLGARAEKSVCSACVRACARVRARLSLSKTCVRSVSVSRGVHLQEATTTHSSNSSSSSNGSKQAAASSSEQQQAAASKQQASKQHLATLFPFKLCSDIKGGTQNHALTAELSAVERTTDRLVVPRPLPPSCPPGSGLSYSSKKRGSPSTSTNLFHLGALLPQSGPVGGGGNSSKRRYPHLADRRRFAASQLISAVFFAIASSSCQRSGHRGLLMSCMAVGVGGGAEFFF